MSFPPLCDLERFSCQSIFGSLLSYTLGIFLLLLCYFSVFLPSQSVISSPKFKCAVFCPWNKVVEKLQNYTAIAG